MSNKVLQRKGCEMKGSTFQSRISNFPNRDISQDLFYFKVRTQWKNPIEQIEGQKFDDYVVFPFAELEKLPIGNYNIEYWANFDGIGTEIIAYEDFRISDRPCNVDYSKENSFTLNFPTVSINYEMTVSIINIGGSGGGTEQGPKGDKGEKGENGYTPIKGVDYFDGAKGDKGEQGEKGTDGTIGVDGAKGEQGIQGDKGEKGADGTGVKIATWSASTYANGVQVIKDGKIYESNVAIVAVDVPGVSSKWVEKTSGNEYLSQLQDNAYYDINAGNSIVGVIEEIAGYYNVTTKTISNGATWLSKKYRVQYGKTYFVTGVAVTSATALINFFKEDGTYISSINVGSGSETDFTNIEVTAPKNSAFAIVSGRKIKVTNLILKGSYIFPTKVEVNLNLLAGKKIVSTGDSITAYANNYVSKSAIRLGMNHTNYAVGGGRMATQSSGYSVITSFPLMTDDADVVIVAAGTNDWNYNVTYGTFGSTDSDTFYGALNNVCLGLKEKYVGKKIIFLTPIKRIGFANTNAQGKTLKDYADAIKQVCSFWGIPVLDMFSICAVNPHIPSYYTAYIPDGIHPNVAGYELMANDLTAFLKSTY